MTQARPSILEEYVAWVRAEGWRQEDPPASPGAGSGEDNDPESWARITVLAPRVETYA